MFELIRNVTTDILRTRYRTTEITETRFTIDKLVYRMFDVGGQRSDRLFWAPYFEGDVNAILFIVSLASFDQMLVEDVTVNRMLDALVLFESIANNPLLRKVSIILFLNKADLFEKKLRISSVKRYFPDYDGEICLPSSLQFSCLPLRIDLLVSICTNWILTSVAGCPRTQ